jgi:hypothetical protein
MTKKEKQEAIDELLELLEDAENALEDALDICRDMEAAGLEDQVFSAYCSLTDTLHNINELLKS